MGKIKELEQKVKELYEFIDEEWETSGIKYYIYYNYTENSFKIDYNCLVTGVGKIYFKTREDAQYIIDNYKEELLKGWL